LTDRAMTLREAQELVTDIMLLGASVAPRVSRLAADLAAARLESANRLAAMRAALAAAESGESDPLDFLRDEIGEWPPARGCL